MILEIFEAKKTGYAVAQNGSCLIKTVVLQVYSMLKCGFEINLYSYLSSAIGV